MNGHIILIVILAICFWILLQEIGPINVNISRGYTTPEDTPSVLIDRLEYIGKYPGRINKNVRTLFYAIIISVLCGLVILDKTPPPQILAGAILVVWVALNAMNNYFDYHFDKFAGYCSHECTRELRRKLKLPRGDLETLTRRTEKVHGGGEVFTFKYN